METLTALLRQFAAGAAYASGDQPKEIVLGDVVPATETTLRLPSASVVTRLAGFSQRAASKGMMREALNAMLLVLDGYTLEDLMTDPQGLVPAVNCL